jgi:hypothetical protein
VFLGVERKGATAAVGVIQLTDAEIGGNLSLTSVQLLGSDYAMYAERLKVQGDLLFAGTSIPNGSVWLRGAAVSGKLSWMPSVPMAGYVNLADAKAARLDDDWTRANGYWPTGGRLNLVGFSYDSLCGDHRGSADDRLGWIRSQWSDDRPAVGETVERLGTLPAPASGRAAFTTQPYEQLATVYQRAGQDSEARTVALARRRDPREFGGLSWSRQALNRLLDVSIQYGYQTWRAVLGLALLYGIAVAVFTAAQYHGNLIVPVAQTSAGKQAPPAYQCTSVYPCFYPAGYAIDTVIPIINVHQASYWGPNGDNPLGGALTAFTWVCTALGWALATLSVAGYTGLARSSDSL